MLKIDSALRSIWRLVPGRERLRTTKPFLWLRSVYDRIRWRGFGHDEIFDRAYFEFVERTTSDSTAAIADSICADLQPGSVIDVGCGTGALIQRLQTRGVCVRGYERAAAAIQFCRDRNLEVTDFNILESQPRAADRSDVALCMEVGHQLPSQAADGLVDLLCFLAPRIVFSSEQPGGGDRRVLNEQPAEYWIAKFAARGFKYDQPRTEAWRETWRRKDVAPWFCRNVLLFAAS